jgi:SAM-dependent methyltransferase
MDTGARMSVIGSLLRQLVLNPRPSKITFRRILPRFIRASEPFRTVLDCGSGRGKLRQLFQDKEYYGVDKNKELIEHARASSGQTSGSYYYHDDILNMESEIKDKKFDLVVCTHVFSSLHPSVKTRAVENLIERVRDQGSLILHCHVVDLPYLDSSISSCESIKRCCYRGLLSRCYEGFLSGGFQTECIGALEDSKRGGLYLKTVPMVLGGSLCLSWFDRCFSPGEVLLHFKGVAACY